MRKIESKGVDRRRFMRSFGESEMVIMCKRPPGPGPKPLRQARRARVHGCHGKFFTSAARDHRGENTDWSVFKRSMSSGLARGWTPVRVKKTRQNKIMEPASDSIGSGKALNSCRHQRGKQIRAHQRAGLRTSPFHHRAARAHIDAVRDSLYS